MRIRTLVTTILIGGLAISAGQASFANAPYDPFQPDVIVASGDGTNRPFFPDVTRLADGRVVTVFYWSDEHSPSAGGGDGSIAWAESADRGRTWSSPRVVINTDVDDRDPHLAQLSDGTLLLSWFRTDWTGYPEGPAAVLGSYVMRSSDGGLTWSEPAKVGSAMSCNCGPVFPGAAYAAGYNAVTDKVLELANGELLIALTGTLPDGTPSASVVRSLDGGRTWPVESESLLPETPGIALNEIAIEELPDGTVTALIRSAADRFERSSASESRDGGRTWSAPVKLSFSGQAHDLLQLRSGELLATYGDTRSGQFGTFEATVGRMIRPCKAESWSDSTPFHIYGSGPGIDEGQPSTVELDGNKLFSVAYDSGKGIIAGKFTTRRDHLPANQAARLKTPDITGNGHHALVSEASLIADGVFGSAIDLATGTTVEVPRSEAINAGEQDFTLSLWFRTESVATPQTLVWAYDRAPHPRISVAQMFLQYEPGRNRLQAILSNGEGATSVARVVRAGLADGEWHHVALTRDATGVTLYLDGALAGRGAPIPGSISRAAFSGLSIGQMVDGGAPLVGAIDDLRLFNGTALDLSAVSALHASPEPLGGETLHLPFDLVTRGRLDTNDPRGFSGECSALPG